MSLTQPTNRLKGWITIGGSPGEGGENEGGTHVFIDDSGRISRGPASLTGRRIDDVDQGRLKPGEKPKPPTNRLGGKVGRTGGTDGGQLGETGGGDEEDGAGVAPTVGGPGSEAADRPGSDAGESDGGEAAQDVPGGKAGRLEAINRLKGHAEYFRANGKNDQADWLDQLRAHVKAVGLEAALESLGEEREAGGPSRVQYGGAYDEVGETAGETRFVKEYLDSCGITLIQPGTAVDPSVTSVYSLPLPGSFDTPGGFIPADDFFENKLEEAKNLPGLESSEDIDTVVGSKVSQFTSEVVAKLDEKYGKGKWIVKSYGDEAFAGFGIFFPQRVKQMQLNARQEFADAKSELKDRGYQLVKDGDRVVGVRKGGRTVSLGSPEFSDLPKNVQRLGKQASIASQRVDGAMLPMSPEDSLKNEYGIVFRRDSNDVPIGITNWDGKDYDFGTPEYARIEAMEGGAAGHSLHRALETDEKRRNGQYVEPKFMVQPAFEAVGVTDFDRAVGATWETAKEGRVHCLTRDGKASIIPYATLLGRGDSLPTVIQSEDSRAMEKAVQEAVDRLPESKRRGQVYAPDVMKTKDGWRVIELNPSEASGGSAWLGGNPFVIDAMVSHVVGREPQHVKFMRDILKGKDVDVPWLPAKSMRLQAPINRFVRKAPCRRGETAANTGCTPVSGGTSKPTRKSEKLGRVNSVRAGNYRASYSLHNRTRIDGPSIPFQNYQQQDEHSCGFVAALTLARYFDRGVPAEDVLRAVKPTVSGGIDRKNLVKALKELGVDPVYTESLTVPKLRAYVERGVPVAVTVWLDDYETDHWTLVQGFSGDRVYLTNYGSLTVDQFREEWYTPGLGVVCKPAKKEKSGPMNRLVQKAPCEQGQTAAQTDCTPASGGGGSKYTTTGPGAGVDAAQALAESRWSGSSGSKRGNKTEFTYTSLNPLSEEDTGKLASATGIASWSASWIFDRYMHQETGKKDIKDLTDAERESVKEKFAAVAESVGVDVQFTDKKMQLTTYWFDTLPEDESNSLLQWEGAGQSESTDTENYIRMRDLDHSGKHTPEVDALVRAVSKAPKYDGLAYRGMTLTQEEFARVQEAGTLTLVGLSSFSKNASVARDFKGDLGGVDVVLKATLKDARDISQYNKEENEVLVRRANFFVVKIERKKGRIVLHLEQQ